MNHLDLASAAPPAVALPAPCWWIDRNDDGMITHHLTREEAETVHADQVREDHGWGLTVAGAFAIVPGLVCHEPRRCYEVTCPGCGTVQHVQDRYQACIDDVCGHELEVEQIPHVAPDQTQLFDVLPTHDIEDEPLSRVVLFIEEDPR
ncbi:hypothetical protein [Amycolatopsis sp. ATCC 39116]|uniref:hypothetical protein n=1 Tax=Amycolatopsis sp. (strain ATCC 39116 / 75iv2) TaxID=385957 RepID=UPI0002625CF1|nr:hypothetical protein [Amycolatopsis sp. ATCC 39116]